MKKIYLLIPVFALSLFIVGCSSGSSDDTSSSTTTTKKTTPTEDNNNSCNTGFSFDANGKCVLDNNITNPCTDNQIIVDGKCQDKEIEVPTCQDNQVLNADTNQCKTVSTVPTCDIGQKLDENNETCISDESRILSGTVFDGLVSGAKISACKIVDGQKSETDDSEVKCSEKTDKTGSFKCAVYLAKYDAIVFKAVGGIDLGSDNIVSSDDKENKLVLKTIVEESNESTNIFSTPATSLVVQQIADKGWATINIATATIEVAKNLGLDEINILKDSNESRKGATIIANILDTLPADINMSKLSKEVLVENGKVKTDIISIYNPKIKSEESTILTAQIDKIVESTDTAEKQAIEKTLDLIVVRAESDKNLTVTTDIADNFILVLKDNQSTSTDTLDIIADITDKGLTENLLDVAKNIEKVLTESTDKNIAKTVISEAIENGDSLTDFEALTEKISTETLKNSCKVNQTFNSTDKVCEDIIVKEAVQVIKDFVDSPEDVPALPNDSARTIQESPFPTMPKDNGYANREDDNLTELANPSDNNYSKLADIMKGVENNQTTPYLNK